MYNVDSISIISKAVHSLVDLIATVIAYFAVREALKPADNDHSYGHGKFENISGTIGALLIFATTTYIVYKVAEKFVHSKIIEMPIVGVLIMLFSAAVNFLFQKNCLRCYKKSRLHSS
ncbi:cation diffusion facilitator family transporter [Candidatus Endomicrobiellum pyrsonymphae]|uniref:cation diffusion facilitator family transporter n=1 Tax=Candidatus Endomicrobiellum pyrsonymphae TaxID=1408203 RepID=UPI0035A866E0